MSDQTFTFYPGIGRGVPWMEMLKRGKKLKPQEFKACAIDFEKYVKNSGVNLLNLCLPALFKTFEQQPEDLFECLPTLLKPELVDDVITACIIVKQMPSKYSDFKRKIRDNNDVFLSFATANVDPSQVIASASEIILNDKALMTVAVQTRLELFDVAPLAIRGDGKIALEVVKSRWECYEYIADELRKDINIFLAVARQGHWKFFDKAPVEIRGNGKIALEAVKERWRCYEFITDELRKDCDIFIAVARQGHYLDYFEKAPVEIRDNPDIAKEVYEIRLKLFGGGPPRSYTEVMNWYGWFGRRR